MTRCQCSLSVGNNVHRCSTHSYRRTDRKIRDQACWFRWKVQLSSYLMRSTAFLIRSGWPVEQNKIRSDKIRQDKIRQDGVIEGRNNAVLICLEGSIKWSEDMIDMVLSQYISEHQLCCILKYGAKYQIMQYSIVYYSLVQCDVARCNLCCYT